MTSAYLFLNAALYALFAVWCTVAAGSTAQRLGFEALSPGGRSEYLVIYGGLQTGLAILFWLLARDPARHSLGIAVAVGIYAPIVLYRAVTIVQNWPVSFVTVSTGILELALLVIGGALSMKIR